MKVAKRNEVLARFLSDPEFEHRVRSRPEAIATEFSVTPAFIESLLCIEDRRLQAFRGSRQVKERRRRGEIE